MSKGGELEGLRTELFNIVWQWFKENRLYGNWRSEDEREEWTADDFHLVTPDNSFGSLAMEVGLLVNRLLKESVHERERFALESQLDELQYISDFLTSRGIHMSNYYASDGLSDLGKLFQIRHDELQAELEKAA